MGFTRWSGAWYRGSCSIRPSTGLQLAANVFDNVETDGHENLAWVFMVGNSSPKSIFDLDNFTVKSGDSVFSELFKTVSHV